MTKTEMYELKREEEWYFFTSRNKKYPKGNRPNRAAGNGYWKASGADINILSCDGGHILGYKKPLVFCEGPAKSGIKTDWKMQEYRLDKHDTPSTSSDMKVKLILHLFRFSMLYVMVRLHFLGSIVNVL